MNYIWSKLSLLKFIEESIEKVVKEKIINFLIFLHEPELFEDILKKNDTNNSKWYTIL